MHARTDTMTLTAALQTLLPALTGAVTALSGTWACVAPGDADVSAGYSVHYLLHT